MYCLPGTSKSKDHHLRFIIYKASDRAQRMRTPALFFSDTLSINANQLQDP